MRASVDGVVTEFLHAGGMEIAEYSASGALLRRYIPGPGVDQRIVMVDCGSSAGCIPNQAGTDTQYYFADRQGNVLAVTDNTGHIEQQFFYTPFGVELVGDVSGNPFRYTGRRYDAETGLYYYRARYYDADLGRFLQVDPVGYADQWNLYAYVGNNPLNATDPTGERQCVRCAARPAPVSGPNRRSPSPGGPSDREVVDGARAVVDLVHSTQTGEIYVDLAAAVLRAAPGIAQAIASDGEAEDQTTPEDRRRGARPTDAPRGTRPIDQSGIDRGGIHDIKDGIGARPDDWVGVTPDGDVVTTDPETGEAVDQGNISDYDVERGGRRGRRDRDNY